MKNNLADGQNLNIGSFTLNILHEIYNLNAYFDNYYWATKVQKEQQTLNCG